jgi:hypothetical protein
MIFNTSEQAREFIRRELSGKNVRFYARRKVCPSNVYEWDLDDPKPEDRIYELEGAHIILGEDICRETKTINIGLDETERGEVLVINSYK